jgi:hypothetical protein
LAPSPLGDIVPEAKRSGRAGEGSKLDAANNANRAILGVKVREIAGMKEEKR